MAELDVVYFAWVRERIGLDSEEVTPPDTVATTHALIDWLKTRGPGYEMALLFAIAAAGLAFTGAGRFSLDAGRPWERRGVVWGAGAVAVAVAAAVLTLILKWAL